MKQNKIYFLIGSSDSISGGVKVLYMHAEVLRQEGFASFIVNEKNDYKQNWFNSNVECIHYKDVILDKDDVVVIPEKVAFYYLKKEARTIIHPIRKMAKTILSKISFFNRMYAFKSEIESIELLQMFDHFKSMDSKILIHNQNMNYSFRNLTNESFDVELFKQPHIFFAYTSEYNGDYLKKVFKREMYRLKWALNTKVFDLPQIEKKLSICYMPRKCKLQSDLVIRAIMQDEALKNVEIIPIDGMHEDQVSEVMKEAMFFLSFSEMEGCPLPPAEAMSCGCYVIGFTGNGADEYMLPEFCDVINKDDINTFVNQIIRRVKEAKQDKQTIIEKGKLASGFIQNHLSKQEEKRLLLEMFSRIRADEA